MDKHQIDVRRPKVIQQYQEVSQNVDGHNKLRQGVLKLEKFWTVKRWPKRMLTSMMSSCMVDAFACWEFYNPPHPLTPESEFQSRVIAFSALVVEALIPSVVADSDRAHWGNRTTDLECRLEMMPTQEVKDGPTAGRVYRRQMRCKMCSKYKRHNEKTGRAPKTIWRCKSHPDVHLCSAGSANCLAEHIALVSA